MNDLFDDEERPEEKKPIAPEQWRKVWLAVLLMLAGGCLSAILLTLLITWAFGLKIHLP